jgi:hypothetical protein
MQFLPMPPEGPSPARGWGRENICNAVVPARLEGPMRTLLQGFLRLLELLLVP